MACSIFFSLSRGDLDEESIIKKTACTFADIILYPVISVVCAVVFAVLILVKLTFLTIKFLIVKCIATCTCKEVPTLHEHFKCCTQEGLSDWTGFLLIIPVVGTIIHGIMVLDMMIKNLEFDSCSAKAIVFMQSSVIQILVTGKNWS